MGSGHACHKIWVHVRCGSEVLKDFGEAGRVLQPVWVLDNFLGRGKSPELSVWKDMGEVRG
jgi:hypothetical protein